MTNRVDRDIEFAKIGSDALLLDLYLPDDAAGPVPVVIYVHAGGWAVGDRTMDAEVKGEALAASGIAMASVDYRLAPAHHHPAQLEDVQAAVRWLRANGDELGLATGRIGAWGASAGGHLAALLGLTTTDPAASVQAVACFFPTTDLVAAGARTGLEQAVRPESPEADLLGLGTVGEDLELAKAASPRYQVSEHAPPFLLFHGDRDHIVPVDQSRWFHDELVVAGVSSHFVTVGGVGHEHELFDRPALLGYVAGFFTEHLVGE